MKNKYAFSNMTKTTGKIGMLTPIYWRELAPGDQISINPNFFLRCAPFAKKVNGRFDVRIDFFAIDVSKIWKNFYKWYLNVDGNLDTPPWRNISSGLSWTEDSIYRYLPVTERNLVAAPNDYYAINTYMLRAYERVYLEHYQIPNGAPASSNITESLFESLYTTGGADNHSYVYFPDNYRDNMYTRGSTYQTAYNETINIDTTTHTAITKADLINLINQSTLSSWLARGYKSAIDMVGSLFGFPPKDQGTKRIASFRSIMTINDVIATAATEDAPLGSSVSIGYSNNPAKPFSYSNGGEFCFILGIISVVPDCCFADGCPDFMKVKSRMEHFNKAYQSLGMVPVMKSRVLVTTESDNTVPIEYVPIYNDYRYAEDFIAGHYRSALGANQIIHRNPASLDATGLTRCVYDEYDDMFVQDEPQLQIMADWNTVLFSDVPYTLYQADFLNIGA